MIYIKHFLFYARIKYQFETSELKNVEKSVKKTVKALKSCKNELEKCIIVQSVKLHSWYMNVVF